MTDLNEMYEQAVAIYGQSWADRAAKISIDVYNVNASAGLTKEQCEAEQAVAFQAALDDE